MKIKDLYIHYTSDDDQEPEQPDEQPTPRKLPFRQMQASKRVEKPVIKDSKDQLSENATDGLPSREEQSYYDPTNNKNVANIDDTRKPRLTLKHLNKLNAYRAMKRLEMQQKNRLVKRMYGERPDEVEDRTLTTTTKTDAKGNEQEVKNERTETTKLKEHFNRAMLNIRNNRV
jgi:hypothetical protein